MNTIETLESAENSIKQEILDFMYGRSDSLTVRRSDADGYCEVAKELFPTLNYRVSNLAEATKDFPSYADAVNSVPRSLLIHEEGASFAFSGDIRVCVNGEEVTQQAKDMFFSNLDQDGVPMIFQDSGGYRITMYGADFTKARLSVEDGLHTLDFESN